MGGLLNSNKLILKDAKGEGRSWTLTLTPAGTCVLVVPSDSESQAGMDSMRSVALVLVDVEVAETNPCVKSKDGFLDLKTFFTMRFISWWSKWKGKVSRLRKCSWDGQAYGAILTRQCRHAWMILSFSILDELVPYTWTTFPCTVQKSCSSILFLISNVPTGRRTMSANAFFYPLDEPLGPFSPLQNGKESTDIFNLHPNIFIINETSF